MFGYKRTPTKRPQPVSSTEQLRRWQAENHRSTRITEPVALDYFSYNAKKLKS